LEKKLETSLPKQRTTLEREEREGILQQCGGVLQDFLLLHFEKAATQ
jgi:hypothetical protein